MNAETLPTPKQLQQQFNILERRAELLIDSALKLHYRLEAVRMQLDAHTKYRGKPS